MKFPQIGILVKPRPHQVASLGAIASCLRRNGYRVRETYDLTAPEPVVFCWSWGKAMIQREKHPDSIICTLDHGYTRDRARLINTGWSVPGMHCGLNGFAEHAWVDDPSRAESLVWTDELELVRSKWDRGRRALLLGQVYGDAMIMTQVADYAGWLRDQSERLTAAGYRVTFRPHPVMRRRGLESVYGNLGRITGDLPLRRDLLESDLTVALNSNGLVESYLMGIDTRYYNWGSMLSPLGHLGGTVPWEPRREWLNRLAWAQWRQEELDNGTWFRYHGPIMHRIVETGTCTPWYTRSIG